MNTSALLRFGIITLLLAILTEANGFQKPDRDELPNFDKRRAQNQEALQKKNAEAETKLRKGLPKARVDYDGTLGTPKLISSPDGFLTGKQGRGRGVSPQTAADFAPGEPHRATKAFLKEHADLFGHGPEVLANAKIKRDFVTGHNGMRTVVWEQQLNDISVFEGLLISHTTKNEELVNISSHFLPDQAQAAKDGARNELEQKGQPGISAEAAIAIAADNVGEKVLAEEISPIDAQAQGTEKRQKFSAPQLTGETEARLVWLPMNAKEMRLCWEIILTSKTRGEMFRLLVDAQTGEVMLRHCLTHYISNASYRVYTGDSPTPFSPSHSVPLAAQPPSVSRVLVTTNAFNTNASPNGWINDGGNQTVGNNVDAHLDWNNDDVADLPRPQGSPFRVFDFPMSLKDQEPNAYSNASVVQLFFLCNWYHDKVYELGFTEAAGNFQVNNFGRGGLGNDPVQADAQDGGGFNNANFSTPPDGSSGRMQMYLFNGPFPDRDGSFDAEIVFHEYTHGLSNRRVGGGVGIYTLQAAGMGEGWSDFYALCLLAEPGDDVNGNYAAGGYATRDFFGLQENYYFGIRRYPYSTDMTKNPLTFKDIDPGQASSHLGIPRSPISGGPAWEVHNQGEVWCSALWEVRANLVNKHGFAVGNQLALQLVTDGMNLSPPNPNFLQARDAIIQADLVNNGGANQNEIWAGFAKRGMGFFAFAPEVVTTTGVIESFALPDDFRISPQAPFISVGPVGGPFVPSSLLFTLTNVGTNTINWSAGASVPWITLSASGTLSPGNSGELTANLNLGATFLPAGIYSGTVRFTNVTSGVIQERQISLNIGQPDHFTEIFEGDNDLNNQMITLTPDGSPAFYSACRQPAFSFPTTPTGGLNIPLTDESIIQVTLGGANQVGVFGSSTTIFYINSNGDITFDFPDLSAFPSTVYHFSQKRISAFLADFNPATNQVTLNVLSNRVAVTYSNVSEYNRVNTNSFQVEMFFDGKVRLTYLRMDAQSGLVGLSRGLGIPGGFVESDLTANPICSQLPLSLFLPASATEGNGVLTGQGSVRIPSPTSSNLTVNLLSSDTSELTVPATVVIVAGTTNAAFDLTVANDSELDGMQLPFVTASAPGYSSANRSISIYDNESAALSVNLPASATEGETNVQGLVSVSSPPDTDVVVNFLSSNTSEAQASPPFVLIPAGQTSAGFPLAVRADNFQIDGSKSATITAMVGGWTNATDSITIHDNEGTNLFVSDGIEVWEGAGVFEGWVSISGVLTTNLTVTLVSDDLTELIVPASVAIPAGNNIAYFLATTVDDAELDGTQFVHLTATAPGFGVGSGVIEVNDNEIPPLPSSPSPAHLSTDNSTEADLFWFAQGEVGTNIVTYDVYFGTNATPGLAQFRGSTPNRSWQLPRLIPYTTYYWQVVARGVGQSIGPVWQFSTQPSATISSASVVEGNSGTTNAVFTVTLSDPCPQTVTLNFVTSGFFATSPADFIHTNGTLTFLAGQTNKTVAVTINGDTDIESDETFQINFTSPDNSVFFPFGSVGTGTIVNDDISQPPPSLSPAGFTLSAENCGQGNGSIDPGETITVNFYLQNNGSTTTNLMATLQETGAVTAPSGAQSYGIVNGSGGVKSRPFTFMANGVCGSNYTATLLLSESTNNLGSVNYSFVLGKVTLPPANVSSVTNSIVIPDSGTANPYPSTNIVSGISGSVSKVTITLSNLNHTFPEDLNVVLAGPESQSVLLMSEDGGGFNLTNITVTFDDDAIDSLPGFSPIVSGTYRPSLVFPQPILPSPAPTNYSSSLSDFYGSNPNGAWRLFVFDDNAEDGGILAGGWTLRIQTLDGATYVCCDAPTLSKIPDQNTLEDTATPAIPFTVGDSETAPSNLIVTASSSNTNLVPAGNILLGGAGANRTITLIPVTNQFGTTEITVTVSDGANIAEDTFVLNVIPVNDPPVLAPISDKSVTEGTLLSFTAVATDDAPQSSTLLTDFENFAHNSANGTVLFRAPRNSGTTTPFLSASPDIATVRSNFPAGHSSDKVLYASFGFLGNAVDPWLRLTTFNPASLPNPTLPFNQTLMFDMYTDKALKVGLGLRETSTSTNLGANGGTTGTIEFAGVPGKIGSTPVPSRTVAASNWTTLAFNLPLEPVASFTGNGILESTTGKGVLEHLALAPAGGMGVYNVYFDNFVVVSNNSVVFSLDPGAPTGASIHPVSGLFTWTPTEAQGPGVYDITIRATDNGTPPLSDTKTFKITVGETNSAPVLSAIANRTVHEGTTLAITNVVIDSDIPANTLLFSLQSPIPDGASISANGVFTWTPSVSQIGTNLVIVRVADNGTPSLSDQKNFNVTVVARPAVQITHGPGENFTIAWPSIVGRIYRVQFKNDLSDPVWIDLPPDITAGGTTANKTDTAGVSQRFYRILLLP